MEFSFIDDRRRPRENCVQHLLRQPSRGRVLLARVIRTNHRGPQPVVQQIVTKRTGRELLPPDLQIRAVRYGPQRHHHFQVLQKLQLLL